MNPLVDILVIMYLAFHIVIGILPPLLVVGKVLSLI